MTKRSNTELARVRAAAKALRAQSADVAAVATVQPAMLGILADARDIVARELQLMSKAQASGASMELKDAKKLQALMSTIAASHTVEKGLAPDTEELTDAELEAELRQLGSGT